jgi:signal transduction protein with GAF and PtsI domain
VASLRRVSSIISSNRALDEMLGELVGLAVEATGSDACLVYLLEPETAEIVLRASQLPHTAELGSLRMPVGEGVTGWVAAQDSRLAAVQCSRGHPIQALSNAGRGHLRSLSFGAAGLSRRSDRRYQRPSQAAA